jgi:DNA repair protein RadC
MTTHANPSADQETSKSSRRAPVRPNRLTWSAEHREDEDRAITHALSILTARFKSRDVLSSPSAMKDYLRLQSQGLAHEVFAVAFLDARNRLIAYERMFRGTLAATTVHPREVAKQALALDAAGVVLHHNHPSGVCQPSAQDLALTAWLKAALALVEISVLDHVITSDDDALSMVEVGMLTR